MFEEDVLVLQKLDEAVRGRGLVLRPVCAFAKIVEYLWLFFEILDTEDLLGHGEVVFVLQSCIKTSFGRSVVRNSSGDAYACTRQHKDFLICALF